MAKTQGKVKTKAPWIKKRALALLLFPLVGVSLSGCDLADFESSGEGVNTFTPTPVSTACSSSLTSKTLPVVETAPGIYYVEVENTWNKSLCKEDSISGLEDIADKLPDDQGNINYSSAELKAIFPELTEGDERVSFDKGSLKETDFSKIVIVEGMILTVNVNSSLEYEGYSFPPVEETLTVEPDGTIKAILDFSDYPLLTDGEVKVDVDTSLQTLSLKE